MKYNSKKKITFLSSSPFLSFPHRPKKRKRTKKGKGPGGEEEEREAKERRIKVSGLVVDFLDQCGEMMLSCLHSPVFTTVMSRPPSDHHSTLAQVSYFYLK